ncbi:nucleotide exchange factor GrpE [bacterium]|nr:nucleotide exchange factor GrpE [bacterium]
MSKNSNLPTSNTPQPDDDLKRKLAKCQKEKEQYLAGWKKAQANLINYKKEEAERFKNFFELEKAKMILEILPILDNFQKAACQKFLKENSTGQEKINQVIKGFLQIKKQLEDLLKKEGVEEIKSLGEKFDPNFHHAIEEIESKERESGKILEVVQKGYKLKGRVLRPAKVKVVK